MSDFVLLSPIQTILPILLCHNESMVAVDKPMVDFSVGAVPRESRPMPRVRTRKRTHRDILSAPSASFPVADTYSEPDPVDLDLILPEDTIPHRREPDLIAPPGLHVPDEVQGLIPDTRAEWRRPRWIEECERSGVPQEIMEHIRQAEELDLESLHIEGLGLGGKTQEVREMVVADFTSNAARGPYEVAQGLEDYGWQEKGKEGWKPPSITIHTSDSQERYDGETSFAGAKAIVTRNYGGTRLSSLTELGGDKEGYNAEAGKAKGMWGRGWKIFLTTAISNARDRRAVAGLYLSESNFGIHRQQEIEAYRDSEPPAADHESFAYVQAKDPDTGKYFRAYAFRVPTHSNGRELWTLKYAIFDVEEDKIPAEDRDQVITAHMNPDSEQQKVWGDLMWNHLNCNPYYPSEKNIVRRPGDTRPLATVTKYTHETSPIKQYSALNRYQWRAEEIIWPPGIAVPVDIGPGLYVDNLRLQVDNNKWKGHSIYTWNISTIEHPDTYKLIHREHDSIHVSGNPEILIQACVANWRDKQHWVSILKPFVKNPDASVQTLEMLVETSRLTERYNYYGGETVKAMEEAFREIAPEADGLHYSNPLLIELWRLLNPNETAEPAYVLDKVADHLPREAVSGLINCDWVVAETLTKDRDIDLFSDESLRYRVIPENIKPVRKESVAKRLQAVLRHPSLDIVENGVSYSRLDANALYVSLGSDEFKKLGEGISTLTQGKDGKLEKLLLDLAEEGIIVEIFDDYKDDIDGDSYFPTRKCTTVRHIDGHNLIVRGRAREFGRDKKEMELPKDGVIIKITTPNSVERMTELVRGMDAFFTGVNPTVIRHDDRALKLIQEQIRYLESEMTKKGEELEQIKAAALGTLAKREPERQETIRESMAALGRPRRERNRLTESAIYPDSILSHTVGRRHLLESFYETPDWEPMEEWRPHQRRIDYAVTSVGDTNFPEFITVTTENKVWVEPGQGVMGYSFSKEWKFAGTVGDESVWKTHEPQDNALYNHRREGTLDYDVILTTQAYLHLPPGENVVLPVPKGWEVVHISLPTDSEYVNRLIQGELSVPLLFRDPITRQTVAQNRWDSETRRLDRIPPGSRIYIRPIPRGEGSNPEAYIQKKDPEYYASLTENLIDESKLDLEAQRFVLLCRSLNLTRRQKMDAVKQFWNKRRIYDDTTVITSVEDIVNDGRGVCNRAAIGEFALLRVVGVPCQLTSNYVYRTGGVLAEPLHKLIDWLDDNGEWQEEDPPNSKISSPFADMLAYQASNAQLPVIHDAHALSASRQLKPARLPPQMDAFLQDCRENKGVPIPQNLRSMLNAVKSDKPFDVNQFLIEMMDAIGQARTIGEGETSPQDNLPETISYSGFTAIAEQVYKEYELFMARQKRVYSAGSPLVQAGISRLFANRLAKLFGAEFAAGSEQAVAGTDSQPVPRVVKAIAHVGKTEGALAAVEFMGRVLRSPHSQEIVTATNLVAASLSKSETNHRIALVSAIMDITDREGE